MPKYIAALKRDKKALTASLKATEEVLLYWQKIASERSKEINRLTAENAKLKEAVQEALSICQAEWDAVGNHPASSHAKDVAYFKEALTK
jgi:hypothetical protein